MMRVHELAKRLGWSPRQLIKVLNERGEYVKSAMSKVEAPVVRSILREFASETPTPTDKSTDNVLDSTMYGRSAATDDDTGTALSFAAELARIKAHSSPAKPHKTKQHNWIPPVLQVLLDEVIVRDRPEQLGPPDGPYYAWEIKKGKALYKEWVREQLNGLDGDDNTIIEWIRLSYDGQRPRLATDLSSAGITVDEAALQLSYGRPNRHRDTIFERFRDGRISRTEAIAEVHQWRRNHHIG